MEDFDTFYAAAGPGLVRQVHALTGDLAEAQDCVQEAFARAWVRWSRVREYEAPGAWVRLVAFRLATSRFRHLQTGVGVLRRHGPPDDTPGPDPSRVAVVRALQTLPTEQRVALVLHHMVGLTVDEISREVGSPTGTVKARLARGRAALAPLLADDAEGARRV